MLDFFVYLISTYGYFIVAATIIIESLGVPLPGETALIIAASFAGAGKLNIVAVIAVAAASAIAGDNTGYWLGRSFGRDIITRFGKLIHFTDKRIKLLEGFFARHGILTVFFGRNVGILRTYAALFAGICRMPYKHFLPFNACGGIFWATLFGMLGYWFGQNLALLEKIARDVGWALAVPAVTIAVAMILWRWVLRNQQGLAARAKGIVANSFLIWLRDRYSFQIHWFLRHWKVWQYVIIHLFLGFAGATAVLLVVGRLLYHTFATQAIDGFDQELTVLFTQWATPLASRIFAAISYLGSSSFLIFGILGTLFFALRKQVFQLAIWVSGLLGGELLTVVLKMSVARPRPEVAQIFVLNVGYSFPSGHALEAFVFVGLLAYFFIMPPGTWLFKSGIVMTAAVTALLIGFSRLYLGVNFLSDVVGGLIGGALWLGVCISAMELHRFGQIGDRRRKRRPQSPEEKQEKSIVKQ